MVIGRGDIASALIDRQDVTFFASGVSNSRCEDVEQFDREKKLLVHTQTNHLVYFSSLSIYYSDSKYTTHKKNMEWLIKRWFNSYTIVRLGNISWGTNPNTLINYLKAHPEAEIQKVYRHVIDKDEFQYWMQMIPVGKKNEMNIPGRMVWVPDLAKELWSIGSLGYIREVVTPPKDYMGTWLPPNEEREQPGLNNG